MNRKRYDILLLLSFMIFLVSCGDTRQQRNMLSRAERLMNNHPDSALKILDSARNEAPNYPRSLRMKYELLHAAAQNKAYINFTSDSVMKEVVDYYDSHGTANEQLQAHYVLGCVYRDLNDAPKALQCYQDAVDKADTTSEDCNYNLLSRVYNVMGYIYGRQLDPKNSLRLLSFAYRYALRSKDTALVINCYEQRVDAYFSLKMKDSVIAICKRVSAMYRQMNLNKESALALSPSLLEHLEHGAIVEAKSELDYIELQPGILDKNGKISENLNLNYFKGAYYMSIGRTDSAEYYYRRGLNSEENLTNKVELNQGMYQMYDKLGEKDSTVKYVERWVSLYDSLYATLSTSTLQQMQSLYDYSKNQEIAETKSEEARVASNKFYVVLLIVVILLFTFYEFFIFYKRKKNKEIQRLSENLLEKLTELDYLRNENSQNIEVLNQKQAEYYRLCEQSASDKNLLSLKEEELNSIKDLVAQDKVLLQDKASEILEMKQILEKYKRVYSQTERKKILDELRESPIIAKLKKLAVKGNHASEADLKDLKQLIRKSFTGFYMTLYEGDFHLNDRERLICILVKLGFETSSIANILGSSSSAISNSKKIILSKLFKKGGGAKDFDSEMELFE